MGSASLTILRLLRRASLISMMAVFGLAHASPLQTIASVGCTDFDIGQTSETSGPGVSAKIPAFLKYKISFYADVQRSTGAFAPARWACQVLQLPNSYSLVIAPSAADINTNDPRSLNDPLVEEQFYSADGGIPAAISFYGLVVPVFPKFFPGGIDKWVGDLLRATGEHPTEAEIKSRVPEGSHQIILRISDHIAEFITPANTNGLGTVAVGEADGEPKLPTYGVIGVGQTVDGIPMNAEMFSFRLPENLAYLRQPLIKLYEEEIEKDLEE